MISIPLAIIFIVLAVKFKGFIRKRSVILYIFAIVISTLAFLFPTFLPFIPIQKGAIGIALFFAVMFAGAFAHKSTLRIALFSVRKEYSILGFLFISPHAMIRIVKFLGGDISLPLYGVITFVIMIPLFITSFTLIRKKFKYKTWKNLQRFAYGAYIALFIHLIVQAEKPNIFAYILMFIVYGILKTIYILKIIQRKKVNQE